MSYQKHNFTPGAVLLASQLNEMDNQIEALSQGGGGGEAVLSEGFKTALLNCFENVAWINQNGQNYYDALYNALYEEKILVSISAAFDSGSNIIYTTNTLDDLRQFLIVTAFYNDSTTSIINNYTLSGQLNEGLNTITVTYEDKTTTFTVNVYSSTGDYTITNILSNCTNSNSSTAILDGSSYSATLSANQGYTLTGATVSIFMGGNDVTNTSYLNGSINIANVTGNIVITATAVSAISSISAVFTQGDNIIYPSTPLDDLKQFLVVTATYTNNTTIVVPSNDYTLVGSLVVGTSSITANYGGRSDSFNVIVSDPVVNVTVTWTGTGSTKTSSVIDTRNCVVYYTIPFIEGATQLSSSAVDGGNAASIKARLYNDEECTDYVGIYWSDNQTINTTDKTWLNCPIITFGNEILVIPKGYYAKIQCDNNRGAFTNNGNWTTYINTYATTVKTVIS